MFLGGPAMGRGVRFPECFWGVALQKCKDAAQRVGNEREEYDGQDDPFSPV